MNEYKIIPHDSIIQIPETVAVCPYCGGKLTVKLDEWTQNDDGTWIADDTPHTECQKEPDMTGADNVGVSDDWGEWDDNHSIMPYVYLLPVQLKVGRWINENFRFDMEAK